MSMVSLTKVVVPSVLASFAVSYAFWDLSRNRKIFGDLLVPESLIRQGDQSEYAGINMNCIPDVDSIISDAVKFGAVTGTVPPSLQNEEWLKETLRKFDEGWPREASCPVVMNPISRQNYRKVM